MDLPVEGGGCISSGDADVDRLFREYYVAWGGKQLLDPTEARNLPDTFHYVPQDHEVLLQKLREDARALLLEKKNNEILVNEEFQVFWNLLNEYHSPPGGPQERFISYENFKKASEKADPKAKPFFTASVYTKLIHPSDPLSRVSITTFFNYVLRKTWLQQARIGISLYDVIGEGYLREVDLENYVCELIRSSCQLSRLDDSFHTYYLCTVVRKFLFFLDPLHIGRVRISDLLASGFLDSMLELRDPNLSETQLAENWFSLQSAMRVYGMYLQLDTDQNGMLTREELSKFGNGTLTSAFLDRVFEECAAYDGEMDYKGFLDFVLAMENKQEPQALTYLFRILDIGGHGRLNGLTLKHFYDAIEARLQSQDASPPPFSDIHIEIFDMVMPKHPDYITLDDLLRSGKGETIVNILTDLQGFLAHENRELLVNDLIDEAEL